MASSSVCVFFFSMIVLSHILLISPSALTSTKYIDAICRNIKYSTFCMQILSTNSPAVSANDQFSLAKIVINLGISYANNTGEFAAETSKKEPTLKAQFKSCQHEYDVIQMYLRMAKGELREYPLGANYDISLCTFVIERVNDLVGGNRDNASKTLMEMTLQMEKFLDVAVGSILALSA